MCTASGAGPKDRVTPIHWPGLLLTFPLLLQCHVTTAGGRVGCRCPLQSTGRGRATSAQSCCTLISCTFPWLENRSGTLQGSLCHTRVGTRAGRSLNWNLEEWELSEQREQAGRERSVGWQLLAAGIPSSLSVHWSPPFLTQLLPLGPGPCTDQMELLACSWLQPGQSWLVQLCGVCTSRQKISIASPWCLQPIWECLIASPCSASCPAAPGMVPALLLGGLDSAPSSCAPWEHRGANQYMEALSYLSALQRSNPTF